jgi:acyl-coenzyme A synthetase/AMP-(fatty) acid ligase
MQTPTITTPAYGRRLLSRLIDERADQGWQRPWASIPRSKDRTQGFRDITYREYSNAIDRCAYWIKDTIGTSTTFEPLVYFPGAALDIRYQILVMAAVKTGHVMFFVSLRNSIDAHVSLLQESAAIRIIVPGVEPAALPALLQRHPIQKLTIPEVEYFLDAKFTLPPLRLSGDFSEWRGKPMLMLHTSGSTGTPKVILIKHGYFETCDAFHLRPGGHAIGLRAGSMRVFMPFPAFHITGLSWSIAIGVFIDSTIVLPPKAPITSDLVSQVHQFGNVEYSSLPPSVIVDMSKHPEQLDGLLRLRGVSFAGGSLPQETGDMISRMTHLHSSMGSTEAFSFPQLHKDPADWQWFNFDEDGCGFRFDEVETGIFEMVIVKDPEKSLFQAIFITFPDLAEYRTKDLYEKHPERKQLLRHIGRSDDIIVFSNGEKLNPITMEGIITACPAVQACLVVGQGRFQTVLIVEPIPNFN